MSTEACGEPFDFISALSFPRPKSDLCITKLPLAPVKRQPRDDPEVLAHSSVAGPKDDIMSELVARRQLRASNASLSSITVSHRAVRNSSVSQAPTSDGLSLSYCHIVTDCNVTIENILVG